jgi:hypothetical protein
MLKRKSFLLLFVCLAGVLTAAVAAQSVFAQAKPPATTSAQAPPPATQTKPAAATPTLMPMQVGTYEYKAKVDTGAAQMEIPITTEIQDSPDGWLVIDSARTISGDVIDRTTLDKTTLVVRKREVNQASVVIQLASKDGKVTGQITVNGQVQTVAVDTNCELFADGAGANQAVAMLPLAEGYTYAFKNLDIRTLRVRDIQLKVVGSEQVTVPAGTFEAFKVELVSPVEGAKTTLWIAKDSRKVAKVVQSSPQVSSATVTSELQK